MMPPALKLSRFRILSTLILCLFLYLAYKYIMFPSEPEFVTDEVHLGVTREEGSVDGNEKNVDLIEPVRVTVFYECLCPDSRSFFLHHLVPAFERAPNLIDIEYIPYGNAKTFYENGQYKFSCQHGPTECYGNKIHACTVSKIKDPQLLLKMTSCMIDDNLIPDQRGAECATVNGISWKPIQDCALSVEADLLLKNHGIRTHSLQPPVSFIPTILLNKKCKRASVYNHCVVLIDVKKIIF